MAVKKQTKQTSFEFKLPRVGRVFFRVSGVLGLILILGVCGYLTRQMFFAVWPVKQIEIIGEHQFFKQAMLDDFMAQQPASGMLAIDLQALQKDVKALEWVKQVEVRKIWPDKLLFNIEEELPVALIGDNILAQSGVLIAQKVESDFIENLPHIEFEEALLDEKKNIDSIWKDFKSMRRQFELIEMNMNRIVIDQLNNWHLHFTSDIEIKLGRKSHPERVERLLNVYQEIEDKEKIESIDLRYNNGFAVKWQVNKKMQG